MLDQAAVEGLRGSQDVAIIGGLLFGTLLTLSVVPAM